MARNMPSAIAISGATNSCVCTASSCLSNAQTSFDMVKVVARRRAVAKQLNQGVTHLMKKNKIAVVMGEGKLTGKGKLSIAGADGKATELAAKHIIVATGARARDLPDRKSTRLNSSHLGIS